MTATTCNRCNAPWAAPACAECGCPEYTLHHLPPIAHPGGKGGAGVYQRLVNRIPPHATRVEAFGGGVALSRMMRPAARQIWLEIDDEYRANLITIARAMRGVAVLNVDAMHWLPVVFALGQAYPLGPAPRDPSTPWSNAERHDAFVYLDPPYPASTKNERTYRHELTDAQHAELLAIACRLPCPVMVSCYPCELYDAALADWHCHTYTTSTRGGPRTECCWTNYPQDLPELHDARFIGDEKRQRERIRRRVRTWSAGLQRMPPLERQAVLDELTAIER